MPVGAGTSAGGGLEESLAIPPRRGGGVVDYPRGGDGPAEEERRDVLATVSSNRGLGLDRPG